MIKLLKNFAVAIVATINLLAVAAMVAVGYTPYASPTEHSLLSSMGVAFPIMLIVNTGFLIFWLFVRFKMALIPIAGFILACAPIRTYIPLNFSTSVPNDAFKVMSYNIKAYNGPDKYEDTFKEIRDYFEKEQPDILCLQEDVGSLNNKLLDEKTLFPYNSSVLFTLEESQYGLAVYSKYPIVKKERIEFGAKNNVSIAFFLTINADTVIVINNHLESTHLSIEQRNIYREIISGNMESDTAEVKTKQLFRQLADATKLRAPQADAVNEYVEKHAAYPIIVCGDFNDNPISYTHRVIAKSLTDCFVATGNGVGVSYNQNGFHVRIDNILCSEHFTPYGCTVDNKIDASDHYPIYCWLKKSQQR